MNTSEDENVIGSSNSQRDSSMDLGEEKTETRVRQFMNILEQLPRLCSPTICGTLSQPTTRSERASRGADMFEWSIEQKAILSPANITEDWQNVADFDSAWRKQESEMFFSQKTIAPSPLVVDSRFGHHQAPPQQQPQQHPNHHYHHNHTNNTNNYDNHDFDRTTNHDETYHEDDEHDNDDNHHHEDDDDDDDDDNLTELEEQHDEFDDLLFSPAPVKSSQKMDVFSPATFTRVMDDANTLQSTPKTTGLPKTRTRRDILD